MRQAAQTVEAETGRLDVLVNNAGITGPLREPCDYTCGDAAEVLLTNVAGYVRVLHAFLPLLERSPDPRVVNVGSGLGSFGLFHDPSRLLPWLRMNVADPGMTATNLTHGPGHSVTDGTYAILAFALAGRGSATGIRRP